MNKIANNRRDDWPAIQLAHDNGASWRELRGQFRISFRQLQIGKKRGFFVSKRSRAEGIALGVVRGRFIRQQSIETRALISVALSINNKGGRCKWYDVAGQKVQGTWERDLAIKFEEWGLRWRKLGRWRKDAWPYTMAGKTRHYTPDFLLTDMQKWLEVKSRWWGNDEAKMVAVLQQYPDRDLQIIFGRDEFARCLQRDYFFNLIKGR